MRSLATASYRPAYVLEHRGSCAFGGQHRCQRVDAPSSDIRDHLADAQLNVPHDEEGSDYYRGVRFQRVLDFMQRNVKGVQMYQRNNALRLRVEPVENLEAAMSILRRLSGTSAPAKSAAPGPGPQGPGQFIVEED